MNAPRGLLLTLLIIALFSMTFAMVPQADADDAAPDPSLILDVEEYNSSKGMTVGIWIINTYDFNYPSGRYVFDFFIYFHWADSNISTVPWFIMNGYPTTPATNELVEKKETNGTFVEVYRVRAILSYPLEAGNHPFEEVRLPIQVEVTTINSSVPLQWFPPESGIDSGFKVQGWKLTGVEYSVEHKQYPYEVESYRASMNVVIERDLIVAIPQLLVPPILFCIVSAFSYLMRMDDGSAFGLRFGLNTSMLISAVLFTVAVQNSVPPTSTINFYMVFSIGVFIFLASNIMVTVVGYVEFNYLNHPERLKSINRYGILASGIISLLILGMAIYAVM